jgi:hypothetical protein
MMLQNPVTKARCAPLIYGVVTQSRGHPCCRHQRMYSFRLDTAVEARECGYVSHDDHSVQHPCNWTSHGEFRANIHRVEKVYNYLALPVR